MKSSEPSPWGAVVFIAASTSTSKYLGLSIPHIDNVPCSSGLEVPCSECFKISLAVRRSFAHLRIFSATVLRLFSFIFARLHQCFPNISIRASLLAVWPISSMLRLPRTWSFISSDIFTGIWSAKMSLSVARFPVVLVKFFSFFEASTHTLLVMFQKVEFEYPETTLCTGSIVHAPKISCWSSWND